MPGIRIISMQKTKRLLVVLNCSLALSLQACAEKPPEDVDLKAAETLTTLDDTPKTRPLIKPQVANTRFANPPQLNIKTSETQCSGPVTAQELYKPQEISPNSEDVLETQLVVRIKERCVPEWDEDNGWQWTTLNLRTYGFPIDHTLPINPANPNDSNIAWSAPGPTFILNAGSAPSVADGTNFKMTLHNHMPTQDDYGRCDPLKNNTTNPHYVSPNCFHGNNVTNFHFHGFHISPREHQDYVLLSLFPDGADIDGHVAAHSRGDTAIGDYSYDVARLRGNQAPGTHWYHAHKHGATALQVLNGLVGTFEVHGEFDKQLDDYYKGELDDRLMVVQQLQEQLPALAGPHNARPKYPLINGQASPIVTMQPGEIQRWRFVGATMQASAQLNIGFEEIDGQTSPEVRQIAMDGVQFAPENYECQTMLRGPDCVNTDPANIDDFNLNPGNRIDLLVKAPTKPGVYHMTHELVGNLAAEQLEFVTARAKTLAAKTKTQAPVLLTLVVASGAAKNMPFPTADEFPKLPKYLADLAVPASSNTMINYQMENRADPANVSFAINDKVYDPECIDESFELDKAEKWTLTNDNDRIAHPFHIHTNPFQLISSKSFDNDGNAVITNYKPPYIWFDTFAIPTASKQGVFGEAAIHYEAIDFTGEFVNHCHILGHEDRGMMQNVQATCPDGKWGIPTMDGGTECPGSVTPPPPCGTSIPEQTTAHH